MYSLKLIPLNVISREILEKLRHFIEGFLVTDIPVEEIFQDILTGTSQLWVDVNEEAHVRGIGVSQVLDVGDKLTLFIVGYYNRNAGTYPQHMLVMEQWARNCGISRIEFHGRKGWERAMKAQGFHLSHIVMTKELEKGNGF